MPYLKPETRRTWQEFIDPLCGNVLSDAGPGELNYIFTEIAIAYFRENGQNYTAINAVIGAFECAKLEFYRRLAAPYEDKKIAENGDVYP